ncbi:MAG: thermonuclease family protein [Bacilli bacterium]|nr:thermonuclease family protein [Bacilli bacterium]
MKKCVALNLLGLAILASCSLPNNSSNGVDGVSNNNGGEAPTGLLEYESGSKLIFTEFFIGNSVNDRALEVSNIGDSPIDLSDYSVIIYRSGSLEDPYEIKLKGQLAAKTPYVISYEGANEKILAVSNQTDELFPNIGKYPMILAHGNKKVDTLGVPGYSTTWCDKVDMVRKVEYYYGADKFEPYDYIGYTNENSDRLGQHGCPKSEKELLKGPSIKQEFYSLPFLQSSTTGGGGFTEVTIASYGDGDTTRFNYSSDVNAMGIEDGHSCRYENLDTPETQHGTSINAQPWGNAAADYTNSILRGAKRFMLQSLPGVSVTETFGRLLCYVWASNESSGDLSSYFLVNYLIVLNGYSEVKFSGDTSSKMLVDDISYYSYMIDAQNKAAKEGLKVHGEKDPNFNY